MNWIRLGIVVYFIILNLVLFRIIYDTRSITKAWAYVLFSIFFPVFGMLFYFSFGINYRKRKIYRDKQKKDNAMLAKLKENSFHDIEKHFGVTKTGEVKELTVMLRNDISSPITGGNSVKVLLNGEEKFPELIDCIRKAKHHIHIEYYIYENDEIGNTIADILLQKVKEGVAVRFIYDDFGSKSIRKAFAKRLREGGVEIFAFHEITFIALANRMNYRNHRKIVVIDGRVSFIGGINVSDKYINGKKSDNKLFWRDTHIRIDGPGVQYLQYLFICDWNLCAKQNVKPDVHLFPPASEYNTGKDQVIQITAGGPDSDLPTITYSLIQAINLATEEILITTPYFIPGDSTLDALIIAALGGVSVKLLVPYTSDSKLVNAAARSFYDDLLQAGAEIWFYEKGFVHAKTMVIDNKISIVGSANMDFRSFDLNFEVSAVVYDRRISRQLADSFNDDIGHAKKVNKTKWNNRPVAEKLLERTARLVSPLL